MSFEAPADCTLPSPQRPLRASEWTALLATALDARRVDERHLRLGFPGGAEAAAAVRDLAAREAACCSFFTFAVDDQGDRLVLDVRVPAGRSDVLDGLATLVRA